MTSLKLICCKIKFVTPVPTRPATTTAPQQYTAQLHVHKKVLLSPAAVFDVITLNFIQICSLIGSF